MASKTQLKTRAGGHGIRPLRFALFFFLYFLLGISLLLTPPGQSVDLQLTQGLVTASHNIISICGGDAVRRDAILRAPGGFAIEMRDGCNALNVTLLLCSAVLAFPATLKMKMYGILSGVTIIQVVNIFRFISLFYLGQYSLMWFDLAHSYLWESLIVLDTVVVFWYWTSRILRSRTPVAAPASNVPA